ncbi:MAG: hypothetical protein QXD98_01515 [Candidatus Diapherotrites archaeon]
MQKEKLSIIFLTIIVSLGNIVIAELQAPNIKSETHESNVLSNNNYAVINIEEIQGASYYLYQLTSREEPKDSEWIKVTKTKVTLSNLTDGKRNFFVKACDEDSCSNYSKFILVIDITGPKPLTNIKAFSTKKGIMLTWDEASDESGISKYFVYRNLRRNYLDREFLPNDLGVKKFETTSNYFFDEENLQIGMAYYYRIQALDKAGNRGAISSIIIGRNDWKECENSISIKVNDSIGTKGSKVEIESPQEISYVKGSISYDNKSEEVFFEKTAGKKFSFTIKPKENYFGKATLKIEYADYKERICEKEKQLKIDSVAPTIESIKQKFEGEKIVINVLILDDDEIKKAEIINDNIVIAEGKKTSKNTYEFSIESKFAGIDGYLRTYDMSENYAEKNISLVQKEEEKSDIKKEPKENKFEIINLDGEKEILSKIVFLVIFLLILITLGMLYKFYSQSQTKVIREQLPKIEEKPRWKEKTQKTKIREDGNKNFDSKKK